MRTVRRLLYRDIASSVFFVAIAFLSLFFFIDFVDELADVGKGYTAFHAALHSVLELPGHLYELVPIAVLIGTIYALSRMAQSSEFTILRTGGLAPGRALSLLAGLGAAFAVLTFVVGDYLAPLSERAATMVQTRAKGGFSVGGSGAWLKDKSMTPQGERSYSINVGLANSGGELANIRIFEFDAGGRLLRRIAAGTGNVSKDGVWSLADVTITDWSAVGSPGFDLKVNEEKRPAYEWASTLPASVVAAAVLPEKSMSTLELFRYISHLADNEQAAQR